MPGLLGRNLGIRPELRTFDPGDEILVNGVNFVVASQVSSTSLNVTGTCTTGGTYYGTFLGLPINTPSIYNGSITMRDFEPKLYGCGEHGIL